MCHIRPALQLASTPEDVLAVFDAHAPKLR